MRDLRPFASLSSGLLARKGQARPAMRPQGLEAVGQSAPPDDLGWNDMGEERPPVPRTATPAPLIEQTPIARSVEPVMQLASELAAVDARPVADVAALVAPDAAARALPGSKGKAAFTLRLDPVRHLRLRLACALRHRSAQALVTEALDAFLVSTDLDALADRAGRATPPFALGSNDR